MVSKIDLFYYGDVGSYDRSNPYLIFGQNCVPEILYLIATHNKYELTICDIAGKLNVLQEDIEPSLEDMERLGMVSKQGDGYSISFTVVLGKDIPILSNLSALIADALAKKILSRRGEIESSASRLSCTGQFDLPRILYHVIGCDFLDGSAMTELGRRNIIRTSKEQYGSRDYILFGYEKSDAVSFANNKLLCSRNRIESGNTEFVSFGDCNGNRNDLFRFTKQAVSSQSQITDSEGLNYSYLRLYERHIDNLVAECSDLVSLILSSSVAETSLSEEEAELVEFLKNLNYIRSGESGSLEITVPVFNDLDQRIIQDLSGYLMELLEKEIADGFIGIGKKASSLSAVRHGVNEKEIANDLWHHVLGKVNELLISNEMLSNPEHRIGEGRYFQAIYTGSGNT